MWLGDTGGMRKDGFFNISNRKIRSRHEEK